VIHGGVAVDVVLDGQFSQAVTVSVVLAQLLDLVLAKSGLLLTLRSAPNRRRCGLFRLFWEVRKVRDVGRVEGLEPLTCPPVAPRTVDGSPLHVSELRIEPCFLAV